jgi:hypothetical protein
MKLRDLGTHANELTEAVGIIEKCLAELELEEVGDLRAKSCRKEAILEARMLPPEPISAAGDEFHFESPSQRMGALRKHE